MSNFIIVTVSAMFSPILINLFQNKFSLDTALKPKIDFFGNSEVIKLIKMGKNDEINLQHAVLFYSLSNFSVIELNFSGGLDFSAPSAIENLEPYFL